MYRLIYLLSFLIPAILISCESKNSSSLNYTKLIGKEILLPEDFAGMRPITSFGDTVVMASYDQSYNLQIGIVQDSTMAVTNVIMRGDGPDELLECSASYDKLGNLYILETSSGMLGNLFRFTNNELIPAGNLTNMESIACTRFTSYSFAIDSPYNIVFAGGKEDNPQTILSEADYVTGSVNSLDFWPTDSFNGNSHIKLALYTNHASVFSNGTGVYVYSQLVEPYVFTFIIENGKAVPIHWIYDTEIKYSERQDGLNYQLNVSPHCVRTWATSDYIYILHIDKDKEGQPAKKYADSLFGNSINVYDWNGELIESLELDHLGYTFWVNEKSRNLYLWGYSSDTFESQIWTYGLPSI